MYIRLADGERQLPKPVVGTKGKFVYYQIPKVGCSTIKACIAKSEGRELINGDPHDTPFALTTIDESVVLECFKFAFIRHPIDRLYSCWKDKICERLDLRRPAVTGEDAGELSPAFARFKGLYRNMPFEEFANYVSRVPDEHADDHFISQYVYITSSEGQIIPTCARFEDLHQVWPNIASQAGLQAELGHYQRTTSRPRPILPVDLERRLERRYAVDLELWHQIGAANIKKH